MTMDLNELDNDNDGNYPHPIRMLKAVSSDGKIEAVFGDLEQKLVEEIQQAQVVTGAMAWLTNGAVLRALAGCDTVSIIVNKEDFLRPDKGNATNARTRFLYGKIPKNSRYQWRQSRILSSSGEPTFDAVRCVGMADSRAKILPRLHHKFLVFSRWPEGLTDADRWRTPPSPYAVWTGSFNATENATRSLENAVIIRDPEIAKAYENEWGHALRWSEPLDWETPYAEPEWRIGT